MSKFKVDPVPEYFNVTGCTIARAPKRNSVIFIRTPEGKIYQASRYRGPIDMAREWDSNAADRSVYAKLAGMKVKDLAAARKACIAKHSVPKEERRRWTPDMMGDAFASVLNGASWREAGEGYGVSTERIRQVVSKAVRMMRHPARLDEEYPDHSDGIEGWRSEKEFWMRRIAKFRNKQPNTTSTER